MCVDPTDRQTDLSLLLCAMGQLLSWPAGDVSRSVPVPVRCCLLCLISCPAPGLHLSPQPLGLVGPCTWRAGVRCGPGSGELVQRSALTGCLHTRGASRTAEMGPPSATLAVLRARGPWLSLHAIASAPWRWRSALWVTLVLLFLFQA